MFFRGSTDLNGLTSYWKFNGNSNDEIGTNNGIDTNMAYISGLIGNCATFRSPGASYITIPDDDSLSFGNGLIDIDYTITGLVYFESISGNPRFWAKSNTTDTEYRFFYGTQFRFINFDQSTGGYLEKNSNTSITAFNWYVFTTTYNATSKEQKIYINKTLVNTTNNVGTYLSMENTTAPLILGIEPLNNGGQLNGYMNALGIYKGKELTALEVEANVDKFLIDNEHLI